MITIKQMTIKELQTKKEEYYSQIRSEVSSSTMDLIMDLVETELLIEEECNK